MMKKVLVVGIIVLFLLVGIYPTSSIGSTIESTILLNSGSTLYVGGSGPNNYTSIQSAINDAVDGDTVFVYDDSSPYFENIVVDKSINLIGENKNTTIIDAGGIDNVVVISDHYVTLSGFTIKNSGDNKSGIMNQGTGNLIKDNIISQNYNGIKHLKFHDIIIIDNILINNIYRGIWVEDNGYIEFYLQIENNYINGAVYGIEFLNVLIASILNNTILSCSEAGIYLTRSINITILGNVIKSNKYGLNIHFSRGITISSNLISNNFKYGIYFSESWSNKVKKNNFIENKQSASFNRCPLILCNRWSRNYWDRPRLLLKLILGTSMFLFPPELYDLDFPSVNLDWRPAKEPYDIN